MINDDPFASLRGWLTQKTVHADQHRYCVLANNIITLYKDENSLDLPEDIISLDDIISVNPLCTTSSLPSFQITLLNRVPLLFQCHSASDFESWMFALGKFHSTEKVTLEDFEVLALIGEGTYGKVFLVRKKSNDQLFAIKSIEKRCSNSHKESKIVSERNILLLANNQFITKLYYAFQDELKYFFVLDFVPGGDLLYHLNNDVNLSPYQIKLYLAEIILALREIHNLGVIYRDLKPANILLDKDGHIKLADFGLSKMIENDNSSSTLCGTYEYLAPEMVEDKPHTFAIDYWCLGVLAYRLIVKTMPFSSSNIKRLFGLIVNKELKIKGDLIGKPEESLILGLLQKDPKKRLGNDGSDITKHIYFEGIDWEKVAKKEYEPEFKPFINSADMVENFDKKYTTQNPQKLSHYKNLGGNNFPVRNFSVNNEGLYPNID